jgi:hypothetical protein
VAHSSFDRLRTGFDKLSACPEFIEGANGILDENAIAL